MEEGANIAVIPVTDAPWRDTQAVFGTRGDPSSCWCQYFKMDNAEWKTASRDTCEPLLKEQVRELSPPPGLIAYLGDEPVGWCAVEPRINYPRLGRGKVVQASPEPVDDPTVWAVTCFVVRVGFRKKGIATTLLAAAAEHARAHGARVLEGYPVDPAQREKISSAELYYGIVSQFTANGFREVARPTPGRALMQLRWTD
ncbi:GNAT family N-acetyltransferase [Mycetocola zhadangensis]|uniref:GNAT family N-acetyltransferase n=1 Tax=Mycetocola zhadangensis TaxID=1164595 RepID=A0A3L7JAC9_9MICO|nr:GNAT family N-acetyltransferase [Mycetocola zhadangensis]RLQ86431.1 GNAT family N-acetyltransferase [Mycetocola zhadangensis]GGE91160.1 N-acetyltransferase [Mycetocola zhadangensis]